MIPSTDDLIDRMVDGLLTPAELRTAIDLLDRTPDGWKRCAAAFLEAQCWRDAIRAGDGSDVPAREGPSALALPLARPRRPILASASRWTIAAAALAAAFAFGWLTRSPEPPRKIDATALQARAILAQRDHVESRPGASESVDPFRPTPVSFDGYDDDGRSPQPLPPAVAAVGRVRIDADGASALVPILAGPGITTDWLRDQPPPVSEHGQAYWERHGFQVDQQRHMVTTTLSDGRLVAVPIDQVELRYTGLNSL
jgi:hypothetical protein